MISDPRIDRAIEGGEIGVQGVNGVPCYVGTGGYWVGGTLPPEIPAAGSRSRIIHHAGAGQSVGWAELDTKLSVALCHNKMQSLTADPVTGPCLPIAQAIRAIARDRAEKKKP
jgi:hypothetical protein